MDSTNFSQRRRPLPVRMREKCGKLRLNGWGLAHFSREVGSKRDRSNDSLHWSIGKNVHVPLLDLCQINHRLWLSLRVTLINRFKSVNRTIMTLAGSQNVFQKYQ